MTPLTTLIIVCIYLGLLVTLGMFASRLFTGTKEDYQLASHSIGPFLLLMSLFGTTMTAFALVGSSGEAFEEGIGVYGMMASSSGIIHSLCLFVIGVKLWTLGRQHGYTTQIQFFRDRLESDKIGLLLFPILVGLVIPYLLVGVISAGGVMETITSGPPGKPELGAIPYFASTNGGVPRELATLVVCGVVLVYVFFGGMRGTAWANAFQTLVFMVLGLVTFYTLADKLADKVGESGSLIENLRLLATHIPEDKATRVEMSQTKFFTYLLIPLSVGMFPHLFQHWLTAKSANSFKLPVVAHPLFIMIVWVPCVLIGVWAASGIVQLPPPVAENPNRVLVFLVKSLTDPVLSGLLVSGILAAIMSSLDSQFLCLGTMFSTDMVGHYLGHDRLSDRTQVLTTRLFIIGIVAVTYFFSLFEPPSVFTLGIWCFSGFASLFPLVFAALYWRGLTKAGAYACVLTTIATWFYLFRASGYGQNRTYTLDFTLGETTYEFMPVSAIFLASAVSLIVVSLVTPKPSQATIEKFFA